MLRLVAAVVCEGISENVPHTLIRVRKRWRQPPRRISVYLEILNMTGDPFDVAFEVWRRSGRIDYTATELVPFTVRDLVDYCAEVELGELAPKPHELRVLLNGTPADTLYLDFGHPKALT